MHALIKTIPVIFFNCGFFFFSNSQTVTPPEIDYVTVNHLTQKPEITWSYGDPASIDGYSIIRLIYSHPLAAPMTYQNIHTINDPINQFYQDYSENFGPALPFERIEKYKIIAFDISGTDTLYSLPTEIHQTIYLDASYDYCKTQAKLIWNQYLGWNGSFDRYDIYCKYESEEYTKIGSTYQLTDTIFFADHIMPRSNYKFYIIAVNNSGFESNSNERDIFTESPPIPGFLRCDSLLVDTENSIQLFFLVDNIPSIENFRLFKSDNDASNFESLQYFTNNANRITLSDENFDFTIKNSYYLTAEDYCGNALIFSDTISNIVLNISNTDSQNTLIWSSNDAFLNYKIYRSIDNEYDYIANTTQTSFYDIITDIFYNQFNSLLTTGKFCYHVDGHSNNFISRSNIECIDKAAVYYFPNAFNPKSSIDENRTFKPKVAYISNFHLIIYDHDGSKIFETSDPFYGWDGKLPDGHLAPIASYIYFSSFLNSKGEKTKLKGVVSLVY